MKLQGGKMTAEIISLREERDKRSYLPCSLCKIPIEGLTRKNIGDYEFYVDGGGPLHKLCYEGTYTPENLKKADEWLESYLAILEGGKYG